MTHTATRNTAIRFNQGRALLHLAGMYPTLLEVILELVQNALDKDVQAKRIWIKINYKTRHLSVRDNGSGVSLEKFNAALASVAEPGRKGEGSLGQFGIGLISPLGKCDTFTFISCAALYNNEFREWTFDSKKIAEQKENLTVPLRDRPDLTLNKRVPVGSGKTRVEWRSEMCLIGFTDDTFQSRVDMDSLVGGIQDRYAMTMRSNKTVISVAITHKDGRTETRDNVTAQDFSGQALPVQTFKNPDSGVTTFRLFVARKKKGRGPGGKVLLGVSGNDFRFPFHFFARAAENLIDGEAIAALSSGIFEGEIISERAKLHPNRQAFEKDDAFIGLCCSIEEWFSTVGSHHLDELKQSRQEQRLQELGLRSMKVVEHLLRDPAHASLLEVIRSFGKGTIGEGHFQKKVVGEQDRPSLSVEGKPGAHSTDPEAEPRVRSDPALEREKHSPMTVAGPKGRTRKVVRGSSFGLQFAHEPMEGSPDLWKLDATEGILTFNIRHPLWRACDVKDTTLMKLQECVAMQALTLQMMPENLRYAQRQVLDEFNHSLVSWILTSDKVRTPAGRRKSAEK